MLYGPILDKVYAEKLNKLNEEKRTTRYKGHEDKFHASSAGRCLLMQQYAVTGADKKQLSDRHIRLFRLGDLVHDDIQDAVAQVAESGGFPDTLVLIEREINIPHWNVRGFFDIAFYHMKTKLLELVDIKTVVAYSWTKMFGRNPKPSNGWYEKQLMTYGIGLEESELIPGPVEQILHSNFYYKKDDSATKHHPVSSEAWRKPTEEYWEAASAIVNNPETELIAGETYGCPFYSFECGYCDFSHICSSPHIKSRK